MGVTQRTASLGVGQTWQDVTASRAGATPYTNTTGKPIMVRLIPTSSGGFVLNGAQILESVASATANQWVHWIIPAGATYQWGGAFSAWWELR